MSNPNTKTCFLLNFRISELPDWVENNFYFLSAQLVLKAFYNKQTFYTTNYM